MNEQIQQLDFSYLEERVVNKENWEPVKAQAAVKKYKSLLTLIHKYSELKAVPTEEIDEIWHAHILHTTEYHADCKLIFSKYLYHAPFRESESKASAEEMRDNFLKTAYLYFREFNESYSAEADLAFFWGFKPNFKPAET